MILLLPHIGGALEGSRNFVNIVAKKCPTSSLGKKFNDWKAKRALNQEQKKLMALDKFKLSQTNHTNASDDPLTAIQENIIH